MLYPSRMHIGLGQNRSTACTAYAVVTITVHRCSRATEKHVPVFRAKKHGGISSAQDERET